MRVCECRLPDGCGVANLFGLGRVDPYICSIDNNGRQTILEGFTMFHIKILQKQVKKQLSLKNLKNGFDRFISIF